jgi:hypothetical protein
MRNSGILAQSAMLELKRSENSHEFMFMGSAYIMWNEKRWTVGVGHFEKVLRQKKDINIEDFEFSQDKLQKSSQIRYKLALGRVILTVVLQ